MLVMCDTTSRATHTPACSPAPFSPLGRPAGSRSVAASAKPKRKATLGRELEAREELRQEVDSMDVSDRFEILDNLGGGAYGMVYRARDKERDGEIVALKKVSVREDPEIGIPPFVMREIANLNRLSAIPSDRREPHIVRLLDVHHVEGRFDHELIFYLVFEHMDLDLDQFIKRCPSPGMEEDIIRDFLGQILNGVDWMHMNNIVHRDLKPQNILVSRDGKKIKIADFGLSRMIGSNVVLSTQVVTQWYRAPEVLLHSSYSKSVDMWSVGCVFAEMIRGRPLFAARRKGDKPQLEEIFSVIGMPTQEEWPSESAIAPDQFATSSNSSSTSTSSPSHKPWLRLLPEACADAKRLLPHMLCFQASERLTAEEALQHKYFHKSGSESPHSEGYSSPTTTSRGDSPPTLNSSADSGIQEA